MHVPFRASSSGIPAIILGEDDVVLKREAKKVGAVYLQPDESHRRLAAAIRAAGICPAARLGDHGTHAA